MEHAEAIQAGTVERYLLQELDETSRREFEEHFFDCQECADEVRLTATFLDNARGVIREASWPATPAARGGRPWQRLFWPVPVASAAAMVLMTVGLGYLGMARIRGDRAASAPSIQPVSWHLLAISRSAPPTLSVCAKEQVAPVILSQTVSASYPYYRCDLRGVSGQSKVTGTVPSPPAGEELRVLLPVEGLAAGSYVLELRGLPSAGSDAATTVARYPFVLARSGDCP